MDEIKQLIGRENSFTNDEMSTALSFGQTRTSQIQRALAVLQAAQRYDLQQRNYSETLIRNNNGDFVEWDEVLKAIEILQE